MEQVYIIRKLSRETPPGKPGIVHTPEEVEQSVRAIWEKRQESGEPASRRSGMMAMVNFPLSLNVRFSLEGNGLGQQIVFDTGSQERKTPRHIHNLQEGIGASTGADENNPYLCLHVFPDESRQGYDHPFLDRGICWVHSGTPALAMVVFLEWPAESGPANGEIARLVTKAKERAEETIKSVLEKAA